MKNQKFQKISTLHLTLLKIVIQYNCNENYICAYPLKRVSTHKKLFCKRSGFYDDDTKKKE